MPPPPLHTHLFLPHALELHLHHTPQALGIMKRAAAMRTMDTTAFTTTDALLSLITGQWAEEAGVALRR